MSDAGTTDDAAREILCDAFGRVREGIGELMC